jgi:hypothetical protein
MSEPTFFDMDDPEVREACRGKRYALCPGLEPARVIGPFPRYIGARELAALYGVSMSECFVVEGAPDDIPELPRLVMLRPGGDYRLPGSTERPRL